MELPKRNQKQLTQDMEYLLDKAFADGGPLADDSFQYPLDTIYAQATQEIQDGGDPTEIRDNAWVSFYREYPIGS